MTIYSPGKTILRDKVTRKFVKMPNSNIIKYYNMDTNYNEG